MPKQHGQATTSLWLEDAAPVHYPQLSGNLNVDVAIVGAGITGLTTAVRLLDSGLSVAVIDAESVGSGVSAFNSGHLTTLMQDMRYTTIQGHFGEAGAHLVAESQAEAIRYIESLISLYEIDCDFLQVPGYLYAEQERQIRHLQQEARAAQSTGLTLQQVDDVPLPFSTAQGVVLPNQARFHPLKYCRQLAEQVVAGGQQIFERSRVIEFSQDIPLTLKTDRGRIMADAVVLATHTPIGFMPLIQSKVVPYRSYILGVRIQNSLPDALFWDMDEPYHYLRLSEDVQGPLLLVGGEDHKSGEKRNTEDCFDLLEIYTRERFDVTAVDYRWSAEFFHPVDGLPYIGPYTANGSVYVATGFSGEGLTCGTLAGMMIGDRLQGKTTPWDALYDPTRLKPLASAREFIAENVGVMAHFIGDRFLKSEERDFSDLGPEEGKIVSVGGEKRAIYRQEDGTVHELSPVCTHAGCLVNWNNVEKTWDCPCHGGRFEATGEVLYGPPMSNLRRLKVHPAPPVAETEASSEAYRE